MAFTESDLREHEAVLDAYLERRRPPERLRDRVDVDYRIEGQSVVIFEKRLLWTGSGETVEAPVAKATYVETDRRWRVYWQPSDRKWRVYEPKPEVSSLAEFLEAINADPYGCFWG